MALNPENNITDIVNSHNSQKINFFLVISLGLIVLIFSAAVYLYIIKETFGPFNLTDLVPTERIIQDFFSSKAKIALFYSRVNEKIIPEESSLKEDFIFWKEFLENSKYNFEIINDEKIEKDNHLRYSLIILPHSLYLTTQGTAKLKKFIKEGGSLFLSGEINSAADDSINRAGFFLPEIFNLLKNEKINTDSLMKEEGGGVSVFRGGLPLTAGIPAGYKIKISEGFFKKAELKKNSGFCQISSCERNKNNDDFLCTAAYGLYSGGRLVWTGFNLSAIKADEDRIVLQKLLSNSLGWLLHKPIAYIKNYPAGYNAAAVIAPVLSDSIRNIYNLLKILSRENIKASFFIDPETSIEHLSLIANLNKYGEVGLFFENKENYAEMISTLKKSKNTIELITGSKCRGCIFLPEKNIKHISKIVRRAGFDYLISQIPISNPEDYFSSGTRKFMAFESPSYNSMTADTANLGFGSYKIDIDSTSNLNDIYVFRFLIDDNYQIRSLEKIINYLKEKKFLVTTFSEIQEKFEQAGNIDINAEQKGRRRIFLQISNNGETNVDELSVELELSGISGITGLYINPELVSSGKLKTVDYISGRISLVFENFNPGLSQSYFIDYSTGNI